MGDRHEIILQSLPTHPGSVPETQRLKAALKVLLRSFGFRCVSVRKVHVTEYDRKIAERAGCA